EGLRSSVRGSSSRLPQGDRPWPGVHPRPRAARRGVSFRSAPQAERIDQLAIAVEVLALQVVEQRAALADHLEEATPAVVVLVVVLQVLGQVRDALGQERDLNLWRTGVAWALLELRDGLGFANGRNGHRVLQSPSATPSFEDRAERVPRSSADW